MKSCPLEKIPKVLFDLKHCLLVRLTYRKADLEDELRPKCLDLGLLKNGEIEEVGGKVSTIVTPCSNTVKKLVYILL